MKKLLSSLKGIIKKSLLYVIYKRSHDSVYESAESFVLSHYEDKSDADKKRIENSLQRCYKYGGVSFMDYWRMRFEELSFLEKRKFVPRCAQMNLYRQVNPNKKYGILLENKGECYKLFREFYKRDLISVSQGDDEHVVTSGELAVFLDKHSQFIVKPLWGNCGKGIQICESSSVCVDSLLSAYPRGIVMEELINQDVQMSNLHSSSVNTIRIITVNYGNEIEVKWPFIQPSQSDALRCVRC